MDHKGKKRGRINEHKTVFSQSPISLITSEATEWSPRKPLIYSGHFRSDRGALISNNGFTAMLTLKNKVNHPILYGGPLSRDYVFEQLHFHWSENDFDGSEHSIDGKKFSGEVHLVHFNSRYKSFTEASKHMDGLAVATFMLNVTNETNKLFSYISSAVSEITEKNQTCKLSSDCLLWILMGNFNEYFTYHGSLTTEPFSENVIWIVHPNPIDISFDQIKSFRKMDISRDGNSVQFNCRPLKTKPQGLHVKYVKYNYFFTNINNNLININLKL